MAYRFDNGDDIYVNDEGLLGDPEFFFIFKGAHQPFAGNGVVVGCDEEGYSVDAKTSLSEIISRVRFYTRDKNT